MSRGKDGLLQIIFGGGERAGRHQGRRNGKRRRAVPQRGGEKKKSPALCTDFRFRAAYPASRFIRPQSPLSSGSGAKKDVLPYQIIHAENGAKISSEKRAKQAENSLTIRETGGIMVWLSVLCAGSHVPV